MHRAIRTWHGLLLLAAAWLVLAPVARADNWNHVDRPIDPSYLSKLAFGFRSHWIQPWRSYLTTPTTSDLRDALGMNFNLYPAQAPATARQLAAAGIRRARVELSWNGLSYADLSQLADPNGVRQILASLRDNGIRPLIVLNSNDGGPTPSQTLSGRAIVPAPAGTRQLRVDPATAPKVVVGRTGLDDGTMQAGILVTAVASDGTLTLSRPLTKAVTAGAVTLRTLTAEPFAGPTLSNGQPNPRFERTLQGWLTYVGTVTRFVRDTLGTDNFDVEIWNELSFGSKFLDIGNYYSPAPPDAGPTTVIAAIRARTAAYLKDPNNGVPGVQIGDGFASQTPWPAPSLEPPGVTAIDKHPYKGAAQFPQDATYNGIRPLNALGQPDYTTTPTGAYQDKFTPTYTGFFPEWFLTGIQTETLIRDLAPIPNSIYGVPHGTSDPAMARQVWITEYNLDGAEAAVNAGMNQGEIEHLHAKTALRTYLADSNKGAQMVQLYAAKGGDRFGFLPDRFFSAITPNNPAQPNVDTGESMRALGAMTGALGPEHPITSRRSLRLIDIADNHDHAQFAGDGTPGHPPLFDRDVLAFFPFQASDHRFVAGVYVMTRDLRRVWQPGVPGAARFDLPPETFRLTVGGLDAANTTATLVDPLTGAATSVPIVARSGDQVTLDVAATDTPRMLSLVDGVDGVAPASTPAIAAPVPPTTCKPAQAKKHHKAKRRRGSKKSRGANKRKTKPVRRARTHAAPARTSAPGVTCATKPKKTATAKKRSKKHVTTKKHRGTKKHRTR
jgi:hypothetical protein